LEITLVFEEIAVECANILPGFLQFKVSYMTLPAFCFIYGATQLLRLTPVFKKTVTHGRVMLIAVAK